jgi:glycosyltransferase involved in cell wall biosynthesis
LGASTPQNKLLSILVPVYNERPYVKACIERVLAAPLPGHLSREIIIVDDASTDGTDTILAALAAEHPGTIVVLRQSTNKGKGAGIRRAIEEMKGSYAIIQDADLEYDPSDYSVLLQPILEGLADVVYGSRFVVRTMRRVMFYHHRIGNHLLTMLSNIFTGLDLTDMETCYKAFRADVLKTIPLRSNRFGIEPEITAKIAKRGCTVYEVPISYRGRGYLEGKKIGWRDGAAAIYTIIKFALIDDCFNEEWGHAILHSISHARRFNNWMVDEIGPYMGDRILEVGSGIGNVSRFLPKRERLTVSDLDPKYLTILQDTFGDNSIVDVTHLDVTSDADVQALGEGEYDTIVFLNVLEHIDDDEGAIRRLRKLLAPGGRMIILVPQYKWLFGEYDKQVNHKRRYNKSELEALLDGCDMSVEALRSFNMPAMLGWWLFSVVLRRKGMGKLQLKLFDMFVPFFRIVESVLPCPGISLICVGRIPAEECSNGETHSSD